MSKEFGLIFDSAKELVITSLKDPLGAAINIVLWIIPATISVWMVKMVGIWSLELIGLI
jgi:hypothetical protein